MPLRLRFLLSLLAVLVLMAAPALYAANRVAVLRDIVLDLRGEAAQSALAVSRLDAALVELNRSQRVFVAATETGLTDPMRNALDAAHAEVIVLRSAGHGDLVEAAGIDLAELAASSATLEELVGANRLEAATGYLLDSATPRVDRSRAAVSSLATSIDLRNSTGVPVAQRSAVAASTATTAAVLVALALAAALAVAAAGVLIRPLDRLRFAMARVADGSFDVVLDLPYDRTDEVGHLSRSFRTMTRRLAEFDRMKAEFVGTVSHDLKTPISVITGYTELMQEELTGSLDARQLELLDALAGQTRTLQQRIDQLLDISRVESGRIRLGLEEIDLRHFLGELVTSFEPAAHAGRVGLELSIHDNTPAFLIADPDALRDDILGNVIENAIRFTPADGAVRISTRQDGDRVTIEVSDTGRGIPPEQIGRIFDRYFQGRGAERGTGLGLAIARAGIEAHGGRVEVQSRVGRGTRLRISLPVRPTLAQVATPQAAGG